MCNCAAYSSNVETTSNNIYEADCNRKEEVIRQGKGSVAD